jgi:Amt family ammonium transporter
MVNITYDSCKLPFLRVDRSLTFVLAGDIEFNDPNAESPIIYNNGDIAWVLASTALVWLMIPGVGFFYSGLLRRKNALSMIYLSMMTLAVVSFQWFFWGFSLAFSETGGPYIGNLSMSSVSYLVKPQT